MLSLRGVKQFLGILGPPFKGHTHRDRIDSLENLPREGGKEREMFPQGARPLLKSSERKNSSQKGENKGRTPTEDVRISRTNLKGDKGRGSTGRRSKVVIGALSNSEKFRTPRKWKNFSRLSGPSQDPVLNGSW